MLLNNTAVKYSGNLTLLFLGLNTVVIYCHSIVISNITQNNFITMEWW
jgi:hypothetical protein